MLVSVIRQVFRRGRSIDERLAEWTSEPFYDEALLAQSQVTIVVQVNGKLRDQLVLDAALAQDEARVRELVLELPKIKQHTRDATVRSSVSGFLVGLAREVPSLEPPPPQAVTNTFFLVHTLIMLALVSAT